MAGQPGGIRKSRQWKGRLRCSCVQMPLPSGMANRVSLPGHVSIRLVRLAVLMWPVERRPWPYTLWCCCRFIRPRQTEQQKSGSLYLWVLRGHGEQWKQQNRTTLILLCRQQAAVGGSRARPSLLMHPLLNHWTRYVLHNQIPKIKYL